MESLTLMGLSFILDTITSSLSCATSLDLIEIPLKSKFALRINHLAVVVFKSQEQIFLGLPAGP